MSEIILQLDDGSGLAYEEAIYDTLRDVGPLRILTKCNATTKGNPLALLTFPVELPDGTQRRVQIGLTVRNLIEAVGGIYGRYPEQGERLWPVNEVGTIIKGEVRGFEYKALLMEKFYLVSIKGIPGALSMAATEDVIEGLAKGMVDNWYNAQGR